ncbi:hypothetical protein K3495_g8142 [Podosphaera aphanis]|nr:hypothetical protein K3495_g8142 [Podosphaera aphanis]
MRAFSAMLSGIALSHYHSINLAESTFEEAIHEIRALCESENYFELAQAKWNEISLSFIVQENHSKSVSECFTIMNSRLRQLRTELPVKLRTVAFIRSKILFACTGNDHCQSKFANPPKELGNLICNFANSIRAKETVGKDSSTFWMDMKFHSNDQFPYMEETQLESNNSNGTDNETKINADIEIEQTISQINQKKAGCLPVRNQPKRSVGCPNRYAIDFKNEPEFEIFFQNTLPGDGFMTSRQIECQWIFNRKVTSYVTKDQIPTGTYIEWVAEDFMIANKKVVQVFRDHLRENAIWVSKRQGLSLPLALQHALEEEIKHVWTKYDIDAQVKSGPFNPIYWQRNQAASPSKPTEVEKL